MNIAFWIITGLIMGWSASLLSESTSDLVLLGNMFAGVVGSCTGGVVAVRAGIGSEPVNSGVMTFGSFLWAVIGAVFVLVVVYFVT